MPVIHTENTLRSHDNLGIYLQRWSPADAEAIRAELLIVHGYGEHSGRYRELAHTLVDHGISCLAIDLRGHGRSGGQRGHVDDYEHYLEDTQLGLDLLEHPCPRFMLGHSNGGLIALSYAYERKPEIAGLIVSNPYLALAMAVPVPKLMVAELASTYLPTLALPNGIQASSLTHDREIVGRYERDPLVFGTATGGFFRESTATQQRVLSYDRLAMPLLYMFSDSDPIASPTVNRQMANQLETDDKTIHERAGELHEILNELDRAKLHTMVAQWILDRS